MKLTLKNIAWWMGPAIGGGITYLLRDLFTTALSAGAVNSTASEPGPGTRKVVDTENKLSLSGGLVAYNYGKATPQRGDPGLWLDAVPRVAGRIMGVGISRLATGLVTGKAFQIGFQANNAASGADLNGSYMTFYQGDVYPQDKNVQGSTIGAWAINTPYRIWVVLRTLGAFFYQEVSGGYPLLKWISRLDDTATLYPALSNYNTDALIDSINIPLQTWLQTPVASDSFNRANGAIGNTDGAGHAEANGGGGLAWTNQLGTVQIGTNKAIATALGGVGNDRAIATIQSTTADVLLDVFLTRGTTSAGIVLRYQDADNYLYVIHNGTNLQLVRRAAGVETALVNAAAAYAAGAIIRAIINSTSGSAFYNYVKIGATQTVPSSTQLPMGLIFFDTDSTLENFACWALGTGGEHVALDAFF